MANGREGGILKFNASQWEEVHVYLKGIDYDAVPEKYWHHFVLSYWRNTVTNQVLGRDWEKITEADPDESDRA